jgi:hypothetical protein
MFSFNINLKTPYYIPILGKRDVENERTGACPEA